MYVEHVCMYVEHASSKRRGDRSKTTLPVKVFAISTTSFVRKSFPFDVCMSENHVFYHENETYIHRHAFYLKKMTSRFLDNVSI